MNYELLNIEIKRGLIKKGLTKSKFIELLGMTRAGFDTMLKKKTLRVDVLERMAYLLDFSLSDVFDSINVENDKSDLENKYLEERISDLEKSINRIIKTNK